MNKIQGYEDFLSKALPSDLQKVYLISHSDKFSFSHVDHLVKAVGSMLFIYLHSPGIFEDAINPEMPVYNYGNSEEIYDLLKKKVIKLDNVYNDPDNLINANDKREFHKKMDGNKFVPKTVYTKEDAMKLKFPVIGKPATGSKGEGVTVFKTKQDLESYQPSEDLTLDLFSQKFDLQREFRVISFMGKPLYLAERIPVNVKAKSLREGEDVFLRSGTLDDRSSYTWKERKFDKGGIPGIEDFGKLCKATNDALGLDIIGVDIGIDSDDKMWVIEANTCPGLNNDQIVRIYIAIFEDFYGRMPDKFSMDKIKAFKKELNTKNADPIKFSFSATPGRTMTWGIEGTGYTTKFDIEKQFGGTMADKQAKWDKVKRKHKLDEMKHILNFNGYIFEAEGKSIAPAKPSTGKRPTEGGVVNDKVLRDMLDMPYEDFVKSLKDGADDPKVQAILNLGKKDGIPEDEKVSVSRMDIPVKDLIPTQSQIGLADSVKWISENKPELAKQIIEGDMSAFDNIPILIADKKYIIDGHHRWSQVFIFNPDAKIPAINLEIPNFKTPKDLLKVIQLAIAATFKDIKMKNAHAATDIFRSDMTKDKIRTMLKDDLLSSKIIKSVEEALDLKGEDAVIDYLLKNIMEMKDYKLNDAPDREYMPQPFDTGEDQGLSGKEAEDKFISKIKSGIVNFKEPLKKDRR